jgi:ABC-2 type transport system permease protein
MRNLLFILQKEFRQIFRNPAIMRIIFVMPLVQLILIPYAADYEVKNLSISVVDQDRSDYSRRLIQKVDASTYFDLAYSEETYSEALDIVGRGETDFVLSIPQNFERDLIRDSEAELFLAADAVNAVKAGLGSAYAQQIIRDFNREVREEWVLLPRFNELPMVEIRSSQWYNPHISYPLFMVPGILAILVSMVGGFLTALNIVAEKEIGTIEQLNVTPIKKWEFILGKLIPFWVLGMISITLGMIVGYLVFGLVPVGAFSTIYAYAAIYLFAVLGIGLLISTLVDTQQQATLFAFFFMMIFILMSGLYTPVESMPDWAKVIAWLNPPTYFVEGIRAVYIKGSSLYDLRFDLLATTGFAIFFNALAIWNYRKTTA